MNSPLHDEQGNWSAARIWLSVALPFSLVVVHSDVYCDVDVSDQVYVFLAGVLAGLMLWAGGPRIGGHFSQSWRRPIPERPQPEGK